MSSSGHQWTLQAAIRWKGCGQNAPTHAAAHRRRSRRRSGCAAPRSAVVQARAHAAQLAVDLAGRRAQDEAADGVARDLGEQSAVGVCEFDFI